MLKELPIWP